MSNFPIVILHGWASKLDRWQPVVEEFEKVGFEVFFPSLPGFSPENQLQKPWSVSDYTNWLKSYLIDNKIKNYLLLGHSFGGRIAVNLASRNPKGLKGLILIDSAGIKTPFSLKKFLFFIPAKIGKILFLLPPFSFFKNLGRFLFYKLVREKDYFLASPIMRKTLQKVVSFDQRKELEKIKTSTLILWGLRDRETPVSDARIMNKKISNSQLIIFSNASHGLPFDETKRMVKEILEFAKCL